MSLTASAVRGERDEPRSGERRDSRPNRGNKPSHSKPGHSNSSRENGRDNDFSRSQNSGSSGIKKWKSKK